MDFYRIKDPRWTKIGVDFYQNLEYCKWNLAQSKNPSDLEYVVHVNFTSFQSRASEFVLHQSMELKGKAETLVSNREV